MSFNPEQQIAVDHNEGPLLILAGAGSGKTRVLTHRVARLILEGRAAPQEILAVTFTNKASKEMQHRIYSILSDSGLNLQSDIWVSTFHSICVRILRQHLELLGYTPGFSIYDDGDQLSQIKKVLETLKLDEEVFVPKTIRSRINSAKNLGLNPGDIIASRMMGADQRQAEIYLTYEKLMKQSNALDFGDLLLKTHDLFIHYPGLLEQYQKRFKYILVDEYQDTNHIQYKLIKLLSSATRNLCVVGDEDQSIYGWRGADIKNILDFEKDFPEAKIVKLERNYRSTKNIVLAASQVISRNSQRKEKNIYTDNDAGDPIFIREEGTDIEEARFVAKTTANLLNSAEAEASEIAIFYRTNAQSRLIEEQLRQNGVPYRIVGGLKFYDRAEVKDLIAYLKLIVNPKDDMAFKRVVNVPARGIGKTTLEKLEEISIQKNCTLTDAIEFARESKALNGGVLLKLERFKDLVGAFRAKEPLTSLPEFYSMLFVETGYETMLKAEKNRRVHVADKKLRGAWKCHQPVLK